MPSAELNSLVAVAVLTGCLWMPYILNRLAVGKGLLHEVGYPDSPTVLSPWAARLKRAHENAVENLVVFAPLVLATEILGAQSGLTAAAGWAYFGARVLHVLAFTFRIPFLRTGAFTVGWLCQLAFAYAAFTGGK